MRLFQKFEKTKDLCHSSSLSSWLTIIVYRRGQHLTAALGVNAYLKRPSVGLLTRSASTAT
jgi:hypothetical protein